MTAVITTHALPQIGLRQAGTLDEFCQLVTCHQLRGVRMRCGALAKSPHKALRDDRTQRRVQQKLLHPQIEQAGKSAGRVTGVHRGKNEVAGQCGLHCHGRRLAIANFTNHDDVGILAHDAAQSARKVVTDFRLHLDLVDTVELVLDGIFERDDLHLGTVDAAHEGVQARGLAGACGPGQKDDARGHLEVFEDARFDVWREPEQAHVINKGRLAQESQHGALATFVQRQSRNADIDFLAADSQLDLAILGPPALGDIHRGKNLESRDERQHHRRGNALDLVQHAVDAVTHAGPARVRLDVHVRCAAAQGLGDQGVKQVDRRRLRGHLAQAVFLDQRQAIQLRIALADAET